MSSDGPGARWVASFRKLPGGWLLLFAAAFWLFPRSGIGLSSTVDWADQNLFLTTLNETLTRGTSDAMTSGYVGPGYITVARVLHAVTGLPPAESLVLLAQLCFLATGAILIAFADRLTRGQPTDLRFPLMMATVVVLFTSTWAFAADLPWTHYLEAALLALLVFLVALPRKRALVFIAIGGLVVLAYQTRPYEGVVTLIAAALTAIVWLILRRPRIAEARYLARPVLGVLAGAALADALIFWMTQIALPISQYSGLNSTFKIYPSLLPYKFVQLFVDTCFYALCQSANSRPANILAIDPSFAAWYQPLTLQHPAILASALAGCVLLVASASARRRLLQPPVLFPLLIAGGLVVAYTAAVPSGSPHLRYGFMRDFAAPMVLLFMAAWGLFAGEPLAADAGEARGSLRGEGLALGVFVVTVVALMGLRPLAGNFLPQYALASVNYVPQCASGTCRFRVETRTLDGTYVEIPGVTVVLTECGGKSLGTVANLADVRFDTHACEKVELIPAITGLFQTPNPTALLGEPDVRAGGL